jgi:hypothetical protein
MKGWQFLSLSVLALCCCGRGLSGESKPEPEVTRFVAAKRAYLERVAKELGAKLPREIGQMFDAVEQGNWYSVSNLFEVIEKKYGPHVADSRLPYELWYVLQEVGGSYEQMGHWNRKYLRSFAEEIFKVVPKESIYFGGTDPGRFVITAFSEAHEEGKPFFTLTQNQLAGQEYLNYVRRIYGATLKLPSADDLAKAFEQYLADAQKRLDHDRRFPNEPRQLKPGEDVRIVDKRVRVSGQVAVMQINGTLVRKIFEGNMDRDFYVEESFPLDWMYPHLTPEGPIFKLNRKPIESLPSEVVAKDRAYWDRWIRKTVGLSVTDETSVDEVCNFADKIYGQRNLDNFKGDRAFISDVNVQQTFSKLRSASGGMYAWRAKEAPNAPERRRMAKEADLAFKEAYCLSPINPETVFRYISLLVEERRTDEARRFVQAAKKLKPKDEQTAELEKRIEDLEKKRD